MTSPARHALRSPDGLYLPPEVVHSAELCGPDLSAFAWLWDALKRQVGNRIVDSEEVLARVTRQPVETWRAIRPKIERWLAIDEHGHLYIPLMLPALMLGQVRRSVAALGGLGKRIGELAQRRDPDTAAEKAELERLRLGLVQRNEEARRIFRRDLERYRRLDPNWEPHDPALLDEPEQEGPFTSAAEAVDDEAIFNRVTARLAGTMRKYRCEHRLSLIQKGDVTALMHLQRWGGLHFIHLLTAILVPGRLDRVHRLHDPP